MHRGRWVEVALGLRAFAGLGGAPLTCFVVGSFWTVVIAQEQNQLLGLKFEVASIKPVEPDHNPALTASREKTQEMTDDMLPLGWLPVAHGSLKIENRMLRSIIASAYRVRPRS